MAATTPKPLRKTVPPAAPHMPQSAQTALTKEDTALLLIKGLTFLITQAMGAGLGTATRILDVAREDLVYWTADQGLVESEREFFIYRQLFDSGLFPAAEMMSKLAAVKDTGMRQQICTLFGLSSAPALRNQSQTGQGHTEQH